jgi:hypothetical protein
LVSNSSFIYQQSFSKNQSKQFIVFRELADEFVILNFSFFNIYFSTETQSMTPNDKDIVTRQSRGIRTNGEVSILKLLEKLVELFHQNFDFSTENDFPASSEITVTEMENEFNYRQFGDAAAHDADQSSVSMQLDVRSNDLIESYKFFL